MKKIFQKSLQYDLTWYLLKAYVCAFGDTSKICHPINTAIIPFGAWSFFVIKAEQMQNTLDKVGELYYI